VPLLVRYPARIPGGLRIPEFVSSALDLGATLADLCGLSDVDPGAGRSLAPLLAGGREPERDFAVSSANGQQFGLFTQRSLRTADWLYVWNPTDLDELYDVHGDPGQKTNRAADPGLKPVLAGLRRRLHAELVRRKDPFACTGWLDAQLLEDRKIDGRDPGSDKEIHA
jgi:arylsulfatase A-like enzyme